MSGPSSRKNAAARVSFARRWWYPWLLIALAGAAAHLWCLGSVYFLDDILQIRDHTILREGRWWDVGRFLRWTYLGYFLQTKLWGTSPVGFHAVNWLLHVATAGALFVLGRDLFRDWGGKKDGSGIALAGALLFVVHPLGSEIPNYARTQDLAWVTLCSLFGAWFTLRYLRGGNWRWLAAMLPVLSIATLAKGPGFFHAAMMIGIVVAGTLTKRHWKSARRRWKLVAAVSAVVLAALVLSGIPGYFYSRLTTHTLAWPSYDWHAVTLCRVYWEFLLRFFVPRNLCSDHFVAASRAWDTGSVLAVAGMAAWTVAATVLLFRNRWRPLGICLWLTAGAILLRFFYYINEYMPEYRIYPGLPWLCLAVVALAALGWRRLTTVSPGWIFGILLAWLALLSAARSFQWHSLEGLCADVLRQYPTQARALWMLQRRDAWNEEWTAVLERHSQLQEIDRAFHAAQKRLEPTRHLSSGHHLLSIVACRGYLAEALAATGHRGEATRELARIKNDLQQIGVTTENSKIHWTIYHYHEGRVLEKCGRLAEALEALEKAGTGHTNDLDRERVERKLAAAAGTK